MLAVGEGGNIMVNRQLECFVACAEELNFSRAAQRLFISQQALSSCIQKLEQEFQVTLFDRKPKMRLTVAGQELLSHAKYILQAEKDMTTALLGMSSKAVGQITVGISQLRSHTLFPLIWKNFHALYPNVHVKLLHANSIQMTDLLLNHTIDLYIGLCYNSIPPFVYEELAVEHQVCVARKWLLDQYTQGRCREFFEEGQRNGILLEDFSSLADFPYILASSSNRIRKNIDYFFYEKHIIPNVILESVSYILIRELCQAGDGVGILSQLSIPKSWYSDKSMAVLHINNAPLISKIGIVYPADHVYPIYIEKFIEISRNTIQSYYDGVPLLDE